MQRFRLPGVRERIDDSLIYVSLGSEIRSAALFRELAEALAEVPKRVLMTLGHHVEARELGAAAGRTCASSAGCRRPR